VILVTELHPVGSCSPLNAFPCRRAPVRWRGEGVARPARRNNKVTKARHQKKHAVALLAETTPAPIVAPQVKTPPAPIVLDAATLGPLLALAEDLLKVWNEYDPVLSNGLEDKCLTENEKLAAAIAWQMVFGKACHTQSELDRLHIGEIGTRKSQGPAQLYTAVLSIATATQQWSDGMQTPGPTKPPRQYMKEQKGKYLKMLDFGVKQLRKMVCPTLPQASARGQQRGQKNERTKKIPKNPCVLELAAWLEHNRGADESMNECARRFATENRLDENQVPNLLRQLRRFPNLKS
jgi:hypothetical protein